MPHVSAHDVAEQLRRRIPGVGQKKLHKLLYYCQGHHLATFDEPLFHETISAWDMGPVIGQLWYAEQHATEVALPAQALTEAQLNTVGYVVSRYGALTGTDLEHLTHGELPWQEANRRRLPGGRARIDNATIRSYFLTADADEDDDIPLPDVDAVTAFLAGAEDRRTADRQRDTVESLRARLTAGA